MEIYSVNVTGHRPNSLGGYDENNPINVWVKQQLAKCIIGFSTKYGTREWVTGLSIGVDQWAAEIVLWLKENKGFDLYLVGIKPFTSQHIKWSEQSQERFHRICKRCDELIICQQDPYAPWKIDYRNKEMVNRANATLAVWNGRPGGTGRCVKYAHHKKKPIYRIDPVTKTLFWEREIEK